MTEKERLAALAAFLGPERAALVSWPEATDSTNANRRNGAVTAMSRLAAQNSSTSQKRMTKQI